VRGCGPSCRSAAGPPCTSSRTTRAGS
jgi:hypothetical protein